jgi:phosphoribosylformylglycinamidine synthase
MASPQPRVGVITYPGSQDDRDALWALASVDAEAVPVWHEERELQDLDAVVLPGGFSYGDYLRCGAIARFSPATTAVCEFADAGGLVLGICNGFQILCEAGLLPGVLLRNESLRFICRDVTLVVERDDLPFTAKCEQGQRIVIPVKHGDGRWFAPPQLVRELEANRQVVLRYAEPCNGSVDDIAGICNERGNVVGLMPHPDRCAEPLVGNDAGRRMFESAVAALAAR